MTHHDFLVWLRPRLENASRNGLTADDVQAIRHELEAMRHVGPLQPFASRLLRLLESVTVLDGATVAGFASEVRSELAPPRERTVVASSLPGDKKQS